MPLPPGNFLVDAHEDIACHCQEQGRDFVYPFRPGGGPPQADGSPGAARVPCMLTLPGLQACGMRLICATLFSPHTYPAGGRVPEPERRWKQHAQWQMYQDWLTQYPQELRLVRTRRDLAGLAAATPVQALPFDQPDAPSAGTPGGAYPIGLVLLMEGLELLDTPNELQTWFERGVRLAGITWNGSNRYASGCFSDAKGLTPLGLRLLGEFERLGMILDLAHLCDAGIADVFQRYHGPLCSTHSNARAVCAHERNLTDPQAQEVARRGGVIGLNLLAHFVQPGYRTGDPQPPLETALRHVEHLAALCGNEHVGIGSDLDGGLTPDNTPLGIDRAEDLPRLGQGLAARGWSSAAVQGFNGGNWWRFLEQHLPA
jgi:microsomal dipeptidase-like Zn-dependent dipeptidase